MTLATRRYLYILFILAFFIITPLVILYANGYDIQLEQGRVVKTGMLILDSSPSGADITINTSSRQPLLNRLFNKESSYQTPAKIKNLLQGEYDIKIEKEGYFSWTKKLTINPGQSTYAENVLLFKKDIPIRLSYSPVKYIYPAKDDQHLVIANDDYSLYNIKDDEIIKTINQKANNISWSDNGEFFLADDRLYSIKDSAFIDFEKSTSSKINKIKWSSAENTILYLNGDSLYSFDPSAGNPPEKIKNDKGFKSLIVDQLSDYTVKENNLYLLNKFSSKTVLSVFELSSGKPLRTINLPVSDLKFINQDSRIISLFDSSNKLIYLIDPLNIQPIVSTIKNVKDAKWINDRSIIYFNDFEIYVFDLNSKKTDLLVRISNQINDVFWHPSNNYVFYSTDKSIYSFELDKREKHNTQEILSIDSLYSSYLDKKGDVIYFNGKIGNQEGAYKLLLQ